jgi:hypothetical protein
VKEWQILNFLSFWERFRCGARDRRSLAVTPCKRGRILIFLVFGHDLDVVQGTKGPLLSRCVRVVAYLNFSYDLQGTFGPLPSPHVRVADFKFSGRSLAVTPCESGGRILIFLVVEMMSLTV